MTAIVIPFPPLRGIREMVARLPVLPPEEAERKLAAFCDLSLTEPEPPEPEAA